MSGMTLLLLIVVLVVPVVAVAAIVAAVVLRRPAPAPTATPEELVEAASRASAQQSQAAVQAALQQVMAANRAVMDSERRTAAAELEQRRQAVEHLVQPIAESLGQIGTRLEALEVSRQQAYAGLSEQVRSLQECQELLRGETSNLVTALRSPSVRGRWGEMQLRRVVEMAGMLPHCDFDEQRTVDTEDGRLRPDLVVRLPGRKCVVVDAKVALDAYLGAVEAVDEQASKAKLVQHARQVRTHVEKLSAKAYWSQFADAPDFVVLFVPGDALLQAALEHDPALMEYAVANKVLLATPVTLIALLRSVAYGWQQESLAENARQIAELGRVMQDRVITFASHFAKVGKNLDRAVSSYNDAVGSLEHRVLAQARKFSELEVSDAEIPSISTVERRTRSLIGIVDDEDGAPPLALEA